MEKKTKAYHSKYNQETFQNIFNLLCEKKSLFALEEIKKYLERYPNDVLAHIYYVDLLITIGNVEEASKLLNNSILLSPKNEKDIEKIFYLTIKLLIATGKYLECFNYIKKHIDLLYNQKQGVAIMLFLRKKLNLEIDDYDELPTYFLKQICFYKEELLIEYVLREYPRENRDRSSFGKNFPLEKVCTRVREMIPNPLRRNEGILVNSYLFKYDRCGQVDGKEVNYFRVITLANSNEIINMYPYDNSARNPYIDLNPRIEEFLEPVKVKSLSQTEKFYQRYEKKL